MSSFANKSGDFNEMIDFSKNIYDQYLLKKPERPLMLDFTYCFSGFLRANGWLSFFL